MESAAECRSINVCEEIFQVKKRGPQREPVEQSCISHRAGNSCFLIHNGKSLNYMGYRGEDVEGDCPSGGEIKPRLKTSLSPLTEFKSTL